MKLLASGNVVDNIGIGQNGNQLVAISLCCGSDLFRFRYTYTYACQSCRTSVLTPYDPDLPDYHPLPEQGTETVELMAAADIWVSRWLNISCMDVRVDMEWE